VANDGVRKVEEEARQRRRRAPTGGAGQHSAGWFGFKLMQTESKIFKMVQTDSKFSKL
jgi:threonine synthase